DWQAKRIVAIDDEPSAVDGKALCIGREVAGRRVDQLQRRTVVAEGRYRFELIGIRIRRTGRDLPSAARKRRIYDVRRGESAHPHRGAVPEGVVNGELAAGRQVEGGDREPGDASLGEARREIVSAPRVGDRYVNRRVDDGGRLGRARELEREHVAQAVPGEAGLLAGRAAAFGVFPIGVVIDALLVG